MEITFNPQIKIIEYLNQLPQELKKEEYEKPPETFIEWYLGNCVFFYA